MPCAAGAERDGAAQLGPFGARGGFDERIVAHRGFEQIGLVVHQLVEHRFHRAADAELQSANRQNDVDHVDLSGEIGREPPVRRDGRPRGRRHRALDVGVLVERLAGEILDLLADVAADQIAERAAHRGDPAAGRARERAQRLECAVERGGHDQRARLTGHAQWPARDGELELRI